MSQANSPWEYTPSYYALTITLRDILFFFFILRTQKVKGFCQQLLCHLDLHCSSNAV